MISRQYKKLIFLKIIIIGLIFFSSPPLFSEQNDLAAAFDQKVQSFLNSHSAKWHEWNVPAIDGRLLYDIIIKHKYTMALEIGTSTGHSSIWIAWALSKTGGKLITIEIDKSRYKSALDNFEKAGLSQYIDARLADAHELVPKLKGPFDFVFSDADKDWYKKYFDFVAPKLVVGGCYTTHNISDRWGSGVGQGGYVGYLKSLKNFETTFNDNGAGMAISFKRSEK